MGDEWQDNATANSSSSLSDGRSYGRGRGFAPNKPADNDDWGTSSTNNNNQDDFSTNNQNNGQFNDYGGEKNTNNHRGGRRNNDGGRNYRSNDRKNDGNNDSWGNDNKNDSWGRNDNKGNNDGNDDSWGNSNKNDDSWGGGDNNRNKDNRGGDRRRRDNNRDNGGDSWGNGGGGGGGDDNDNWGESGGGRDDRRGGDRGGDNRRGGRGRGGGRGGRGGGRGGDRDGDRDGGYRGGGDRRRNNDNDGGDDWGAGGGGGDGGRGNRRNNRDGDNDNGGDNFGDDNQVGEDGETKKPPVTYIPPEEDEEGMFEAGVTAGINFDKYDNIKVNVTGDDVPPPAEKFQDLNLRQLLIENIEKSGYKKPTPVQKHAIPITLRNRDIMACAQTGSGKTAAYLIPIIHNLLADLKEVTITERGCEPQVIVMAPTRELVTQICNEARKFAKGTVLKCIPCYGGVKPGYQADQLRNGAHIVVATPGRLNDFVESGRVKFGSIRYMVLDEADRMLDQGFLSAMEQILGHESMVPTGERVTSMFSATFGSDVQQLATKFLNNYLFLAVGIVGSACTDVEQNFYEVIKKDKRSKLKELLEQDQHTLDNKTLVFVETKKTADFLAAYLSEQKFPSTSIHGDREQREREMALGDFRSGKMPILVATSVAARGLDIKNVSHVINYDLPKGIDDYIHRIGRTGRVGNRGRATSFYNPETDTGIVSELVTVLKQAGQAIPPCFEGGSGDYDGGRADFGGYDIRDNYKPVETEPQESW